ncbi:MAG: YhcH/YjgK/YiaL family protein [Bacteroidaceae bacterium]|nr:YhcH/YjgK/YiaL family protein [Bacteroidaceae bacterium]
MKKTIAPSVSLQRDSHSDMPANGCAAAAKAAAITKRLLLAIVMLASVTATAQTYTNEYPKELTRLAQKWMNKGTWRNGFTKAAPAPTVNPVEFYIQYHRNTAQWEAVFKWLQQTDLMAIPAGRAPIPGTTLTVSVEDGDNWCSQDDLRQGKGSESHYQKIDFMYVVSGTEGFCRLDHETSTPLADYKPDRLEYAFSYDRLQQFTSIPGTFNIMFPCDWHIAKVKTDAASQRLRVLVIKIDYKL